MFRNSYGVSPNSVLTTHPQPRYNYRMKLAHRVAMMMTYQLCRLPSYSSNRGAMLAPEHFGLCRIQIRLTSLHAYCSTFETRVPCPRRGRQGPLVIFETLALVCSPSRISFGGDSDVITPHASCKLRLGELRMLEGRYHAFLPSG